MTWWQLIKTDLKAILADRAILVTLFGGIVFYAVMYPLPYLNQVPTEQAVVVVDSDDSTLSRQLIRHADASPQVAIVARLASESQAQTWVREGRAQGMLIIPEGFRRKLMLGQGTTVAFGGDANYFLVYSAIAQGLVSVNLDMAKQVQKTGMLARGQNPRLAELSVNAIQLNSLPAFNPSLGYMSYIVPAVMLLVLHQTLLIGAGIIGAGQWGKPGYWSQVSPARLLLARLTALMILYLGFSSFYLGICHHVYELPVRGAFSQVTLLMLPFLLASAAFGIALSCLLKGRDRPTQLVLLISMPILFASGLIWPVELIPEPIRLITEVIPAVPGIMAMVKLNQMGADWSAVHNDWLQLWALTLGYLLLAFYGIRYRQAQLSTTETSATAQQVPTHS
ncbi:ABC transporter permease [Paraferrimonas sedimenticola]|uniref:ABC transporter n=1 Tax=Paraferrimonas sedimenticola TaxID=375674 RepID=A0AA37W1X1_9GAMM|nr:ABC transporter permease [Paraferrimonas sedimenticola]GLP96972.1 ABC transporter [Paraferrimonas sedimenticola]